MCLFVFPSNLSIEFLGQQEAKEQGCGKAAEMVALRSTASREQPPLPVSKAGKLGAKQPLPTQRVPQVSSDTQIH